MKFMEIPYDLLNIIALKSNQIYCNKSNYITIYSNVYDTNQFFKNLGYKPIILYDNNDYLNFLYLSRLNINYISVNY